MANVLFAFEGGSEVGSPKGSCRVSFFASHLVESQTMKPFSPLSLLLYTNLPVGGIIFPIYSSVEEI